MIKKTLFFGNPAYLNTKDEQMQVQLYDEQGNKCTPKSIPIEDIGIIVLEHPQVTITHGLLQKLTENNVALISCSSNYLPSGLLMPLSGNTIQAERFRAQLESSEPLRKQLWQQTIMMKIRNQAAHLKANNIEVQNMYHWANSVKSGDSENHEARAAAYYWGNIFPSEMNFRRERAGLPPNNLLNYGYAILRATVARNLVASGLLPTLGIHHHNRYNAYALADDIMEPYRPYVDKVVLDIVKSGEPYEELTTELKRKLLNIPVLDIYIDEQRSPLMVGLQRTTTSLARCFDGEIRKIIYPEYIESADE